jgi:hypothetical protein
MNDICELHGVGGLESHGLDPGLGRDMPGLGLEPGGLGLGLDRPGLGLGLRCPGLDNISAIQRRIKGLVRGTGHASGRKCIFDAKEEEELGGLLKTLSKRGFPLTASKVKGLAYEYATKKGKVGISTQKGKAGYYWFINFTQRQHLSLRTPEALSLGRAAGMNRTVVSNWFSELEKLIADLKIRDVPSHLWNCDETGLQEHFVQGRIVAETVSHAIKSRQVKKEKPQRSSHASTQLEHFVHQQSSSKENA